MARWRRLRGVHLLGAGPDGTGGGRAGAAEAEEGRGQVFGPSSGLVLLSGVGLVLTSEAFGWGDAFVLIGLVAFVLSAILGATVGKRNSERLVEAGSTGSGVTEALRSWRLGTTWDVVILFVVIWAMITKIGT